MFLMEHNVMTIAGAQYRHDMQTQENKMEEGYDDQPGNCCGAWDKGAFTVGVPNTFLSL